MSSALGEDGLFALRGEEDVDLTGEEPSDGLSLDSDLDLDFDLFKATGKDLDFELLPAFLGDLDFFLTGSGECDFDRCLRDNERDLERLPDLGGERFFLAVDRERLLTGDLDLDRRRVEGVLDLVRLRGLLDLERWLRFRSTMDRDRVLLLLRPDRERERRDLGSDDFLRLDKDRLLERFPPARLGGDRDLERRTRRLDLEWERRVLVTERDRERLPGAPPRLGERVRERLITPRERDFDLRLLFGDQDGDVLRPLRLGDRDTFLLGEGELRRRFGEMDKELLCLLGDLDFLGDFDTFFWGVREGEVDWD